MARPTKNQNESRSRLLQIRLTEAEYETFRMAAESAGTTISGWARQQMRDAARTQLKRIAKQYLDPEDLND